MSHPLPTSHWQSMDLFSHAEKDFLLVVYLYVLAYQIGSSLTMDVSLQPEPSGYLWGSGVFNIVRFVKIVKILCRKAECAGDNPWKAIFHWRNKPEEGLHLSPARLMAMCSCWCLRLLQGFLTSCV